MELVNPWEVVHLGDSNSDFKFGLVGLAALDGSLPRRRKTLISNLTYIIVSLNKEMVKYVQMVCMYSNVENGSLAVLNSDLNLY